MTIGIVTLSFNQGLFLSEAIRSVAVQAPHDIEYVIIDPGSTDGSRAIIESQRSQFASVVLERDTGPADGLNRGFSRLRKAEICGYINADDRFAPGALDYVCQYFSANPDTDVLLGSVLLIDQNGKPDLRARKVEKISLSDYANGTCCIWQQATFFTRQAFRKTQGFNVENRTCWDSELVVDLLLLGANVRYTTRVLGDFRIHPTSITGSGSRSDDYHRQQRLIQRKIFAHGTPAPPALNRIARCTHKVDPWRHASNVAVGILERRRRAGLWRRTAP